MKTNHVKICLLAFLAFASGSIKAQDTTSAFSLKEAQEYAIKNNANFQNAEIDRQIALAKKREVTGIGLPQISGSFDMKNYLEVPTQVIPNFLAPAIIQTLNQAGFPIPMPDDPGLIAAQFGTKFNATGAVQASQIIFSSDYLVGLQASKTFMELSEKGVERSRIQTYAEVAKAYYQVLVNRERLKLLDKNVARIKKTFDDTKALNQSGFVEKIDLDRIEVAYNNLLVELEKTTRLIGLTETLLKFQMGYNVMKPITLKDSLNIDMLPAIDENTAKDTSNINYSNRIEYSLLETQMRLGELDLKRNRMSYLPSLVAYGNLSTTAQRPELDMFKSTTRWYPIALIGATLNVPIFDGLQKHYRIEQAQLNLLKTKNNIKNFENAISMEVTVARVNYTNAAASLATQKRNMELAENIFDVSKKKYDAGVGSNLEVITAETSLKEAQTNYFAAMYDFLVAKIDLDKATGNLK